MIKDYVYIILLIFIWLVAKEDFDKKIIRNVYVIVGLILGFSSQALLVSNGSLFAIYGILVGLTVLMPGYLLGFTGAGDVKMMAAVGAFLGPLGAFQAALASIVAGSIIAIGYILYAVMFKRTASPLGRYGLMARTIIVTGRPIYIAPEKGEVMGRKFPFAVSIAIGTTGWMIWQWPLG